MQPQLQPSPWRVVIETMFRIVDKDGVDCDFLLNPIQARLDAAWGRRNIIPKARQPGVSSYVIARYVAKCLGMQNRTCVIISHETDSTQRLLNRANYIISHLKGVDGVPGSLKPNMGRHSRNELYFKKTNSTIYIGTAGQRAFGHGDTITDLHLSEVARYEDPEKIVRGTFPAAERGEITVESTGNGVGNWYHRQCVRAREGRGFKLHFFPWQEVPEYQLPFASDVEREAFAGSLAEDLDELRLLGAGVSLEQLQWRREQLNTLFDGDLRTFREAYPFDFDECFQSKGFGFFKRLRWQEAAEWVQAEACLWKLSNHPLPGLTYVIGADVAGGVGGDNSVAEVFCPELGVQVAEYASAHVEPDQFGVELARLGRMFNFAYINVERNNHGLTTIATLVQADYPQWLLHRNTHGEQAGQEVLSRLSHFGTQVGPANRGIIIGTARRLLADEFTIHSPLLKSELLTFVEKEDGKVEADTGCHDDRVFAACHALIAVERAGIVASAGERAQHASLVQPNPFGFDALFGELAVPAERYGTPLRYH